MNKETIQKSLVDRYVYLGQVEHQLVEYRGHIKKLASEKARVISEISALQAEADAVQDYQDEDGNNEASQK